jgi:hypothetical protein
MSAAEIAQSMRERAAELEREAKRLLTLAEVLDPPAAYAPRHPPLEELWS